jgi:hypothetical protein
MSETMPTTPRPPIIAAIIIATTGFKVAPATTRAPAPPKFTEPTIVPTVPILAVLVPKGKRKRSLLAILI